MDTETLLCWGKDIAHFLFSTLHLLLTRILPLIVILVGSLLLHLLRLIISFLSPIWAWNALLSKKNPSESVMHDSPAGAFNNSADHALQEEELDLCTDRQELGSAFAVQGELAHHAPNLLQEERFEDCFNADFIEGQRVLLKQYEDMKRRVKTSANREMSEAATVEALMLCNPVGNSLQQRISRDEFWQGRRDSLRQRRPLLDQAGDNLRQSGVRGASSDQRKMGYFVTEEARASDAQGTRPSQPSTLFPSDLPLTLDDVVQAVSATAKDDAERSRHRGGRVPSLTRRSIPPTLSNVQKALQEMRAEENTLHTNGAAAAPFSQAQPAMPANPTARTTSYENFFTKFSQHFKLDHD